MTSLLITLPLIGAILGIVLAVMIALSKGAHRNNKAAKLILLVIVLLNVHSLLDSWGFYLQQTDWIGVGSSYLHYHLIGGLFLFYAHRLFGIEVNLKLWGRVLVLYTLIRWGLLMSGEDASLEEILRTTELSPTVIVFTIDYFLSLLLNILLLFFAFQKVNTLTFAARLSRSEQTSYLWLKNLLLIAIILYLALLLTSIISIFFETQWLFFMQVESLLISLFCFAIAFVAIRFPVFAVYGDFEDLPADTKTKYANSSLNADGSEQLWKQIITVMEGEKAYLNPTFRLNDLAEKTGTPLHHISQVINQRQNRSFSDFVNQYRVEEAKKLLKSPRANEITILAIALEVGFNSKTAFYNAFKKLTGKTPSTVKKEEEGYHSAKD